MILNIKKQQGQSIIEVVVSLGIVVLVILALVRVTITSMRNASFARDQALATKYAQEWVEEARQLRDRQRNAFFVADYCDDNPLNDPDGGGDNNPDGRGIFDRNRDCTFDGDKTMNVVVTVDWTDAGGSHQSRLETRLTNWK